MRLLRYARERLALARVPITLVQTPAEALPFPNASFDSAIATLVFCSVEGPRRALRVLKTGGSLLLVEHVRSHHRLAAWLQDLLVPLMTQLASNCHWNCNTERLVTRVVLSCVPPADWEQGYSLSSSCMQLAPRERSRHECVLSRKTSLVVRPALAALYTTHAGANPCHDRRRGH
jgi:SAM-dependent methyltransferase